MELNLNFPNAKHFSVELRDGAATRRTGVLDFESPITKEDREEFAWYFETFATRYTSDPDYARAARVVERIADCGTRLYNAAFGHLDAHDKIRDFIGSDAPARRLTVSAEVPAILALPWELLHRPEKGAGFVFQHHPPISICRRFEGTEGTNNPFTPDPKESLRLLFIVSRPEKQGFIDPRSEPQAVMDALDENAPGRVEVEFLYPPTFSALRKRLNREPAVDIVHFDGHGSYHPTGDGAKDHDDDGKTAPPSGTTYLKRAAGYVGHLLFEDGDGGEDAVTADKLGELLFGRRIPLVVLSACQSGALHATEEPMGCVAARLTSAGIPAVIAMTQSVLVSSTYRLFGEFYQHLARGGTTGASLDAARWALYEDPRKHVRWYGSRKHQLELHDWFLPAHYESGADVALLKKVDDGAAGARRSVEREWRAAGEATTDEEGNPDARLARRHEAGFFGRKRELWNIERWFVGGTRRISVVGFGGQGKTELAMEAGRWLTRTGLFTKAVFVNFATFRGAGEDAVGYAVACISSVLDESLLDAEAAAEALGQTPTLVILDNLEALGDDVHSLLSAAIAWSAAGGSRVLCTSRTPDFQHPRYKTDHSDEHRRIQLDGLGTRDYPDAALDFFAALTRLGEPPTVKTPEREALVNLFADVRFHPLSIRVLAAQLKTRPIANVGERLEALLRDELLMAALKSGDHTQETPEGLLASLILSLDRLDEQARAVLPRLGVFQGGAMEPELLAITELGDATGRKQLEEQIAQLQSVNLRSMLSRAGLRGISSDDDVSEEMLAPLRAKIEAEIKELQERLSALPPYDPEADLWPAMRRQLESAALIEAESIPGIGVPFLRFHPTLQGLLWARLDAAERDRLALAHRKRYYALAGYLYHEDRRNPHQVRAIARRELPNLLHAVHAALDAADPDAVDFADSVNRFVGTIFGLKQEAARLGEKAYAIAGDVGSKPWLMARSNRGERLWSEGRVDEARKVFEEILATLGDVPSYERAVTLHRLGRCFESAGRPDLAEARYREALEVLDRLEDSDNIKRERGVVHTDLADVLCDQGRYTEAREEYEAGLETAKKQEDGRQQGVVLGQLGTLAMREGKLDEAVTRYREALALFQRLGEPATEAIVWHQLGIVFQEARQWDEAERHYRESARIKEEQGDLAGAARTWNQLAIVSKEAGKPTAAEDWFRKAIDAGRKLKDRGGLSKRLNNLADLLQSQPGRLAEARALAEEALAIDQTLDPGAAEIWKTYNILAQIADKEAAAAADAARRAALEADARDHRRGARDAEWAFQGTRHSLKRRYPLIQAVVHAAQDPSRRPELEKALAQYSDESWKELRVAVSRIVDGERDEHVLQEGQFGHSPMIIRAILRALDDPSVLEELQPAAADDAFSPDGGPAAPDQPARIKETLASLPPAVRGAVEAGDVAQFQAALADLPEAEVAAIIQALETAGIIGRRPDATPHPPHTPPSP